MAITTHDRRKHKREGSFNLLEYADLIPLILVLAGVIITIIWPAK